MKEARYTYRCPFYRHKKCIVYSLYDKCNPYECQIFKTSLVATDILGYILLEYRKLKVKVKPYYSKTKV